MILLDGRKVRDEIARDLKRRIESLLQKPKLAIVQVGSNKESSAYIEQKKKFAERLGVLVNHLSVPESITENELIMKLKELNADKTVHGIIVQLPLPPSLAKEKIIKAIEPEKDIDGLTEINEKLFREGKPRFIPATARGIAELLERYHIPVFDKKVAVLGRSKLVGAPTALLLKEKGAKVTVCHSQTPNTKEITRESDIIIVAVGKPELVDASYVRDDRTQTVVDVGINPIVENGVAARRRVSSDAVLHYGAGRNSLLEELPSCKLVGDVDFESVKDMVAAISPVPGGVGPMTVAALFENVVSAYEIQLSKS